MTSFTVASSMKPSSKAVALQISSQLATVGAIESVLPHLPRIPLGCDTQSTCRMHVCCCLTLHVSVMDQQQSWDDIEAELLGGQKLQGTIALREAVAVLKKHNVLNEFPLFDMTYKIAFEGVSPDHIWKLPRSAPPQKVTKRLARPCAASAGLILPEMTTTPVSTYSGAGGAGAGAATQ